MPSAVLARISRAFDIFIPHPNRSKGTGAIEFGTDLSSGRKSEARRSLAVHRDPALERWSLIADASFRALNRHSFESGVSCPGDQQAFPVGIESSRSPSRPNFVLHLSRFTASLKGVAPNGPERNRDKTGEH